LHARKLQPKLSQAPSSCQTLSPFPPKEKKGIVVIIVVRAWGVTEHAIGYGRSGAEEER
jgi:hypothetical protein